MSSPEFLQETLQANLRLQAKVIEELERIAKRKAENRRQVARLVQHLVATWNQSDTKRQPPIPPPHNKANEKWNYDPYRRWTRRFFVDPHGSVPDSNPDVIRRRKLEEEHQPQLAFCHTNASPWSSKESTMLQNIVKQMRIQATEQSSKMTTSVDSQDTDDGQSVDFDQVATLLQEAATRKTQKKQSPLLLPRSAQDCRLHDQFSQKMVVTPFSKQESLYILEQVHLHDGKRPNWKTVARSLSERHQHRRTAWQCLCHYQTKLASASSAPWTLPEDELLFWYLAAMGPQFLLDLGSAAHLSSRLLPDKVPKQILARANQTLLNPNVGRDIWSDEDQRKLVLCMKIYSDSPSPLTKAAAHFPNRASKSVAEKWNRSLDPKFTSRPFTPQEDQALLEAIRCNKTWSAIASQFSQFQIQRLYRRWRLLATDDDLVRYGNELKRKEGAKRGLVGSGDGALLNPDDFVLQVKKRARR